MTTLVLGPTFRRPAGFHCLSGEHQPPCSKVALTSLLSDEAPVRQKLPLPCLWHTCSHVHVLVQPSPVALVLCSGLCPPLWQLCNSSACSMLGPCPSEASLLPSWGPPPWLHMAQALMERQCWQPGQGDVQTR